MRANARDSLFWNIWDMRTSSQKNALIDAYRAEVLHEAANTLGAEGAVADVIARLRRFAEDCPHCPDGHTPPTGGSQPWVAWIAEIRACADALAAEAQAHATLALVAATALQAPIVEAIDDTAGLSQDEYREWSRAAG